MVDRSSRRLARGLSVSLGVAVGLLVATGILASMLADLRLSPHRKALPLRPTPVGETASADASEAAQSVRSFLLLERAGLYEQMSGFVTHRAQDEWFRPDSWRGVGRLVRFDTLTSMAETRAAEGEGALSWAVPVAETHDSQGEERTRRFVYRVVAEGGRWLIDDYEVGPAEGPAE